MREGSEWVVLELVPIKSQQSGWDVLCLNISDDGITLPTQITLTPALWDQNSLPVPVTANMCSQKVVEVSEKMQQGSVACVTEELGQWNTGEMYCHT